MYSSRVPRGYGLVALSLLLLVIGTTYYLYDDEPYYPSGLDRSGRRPLANVGEVDSSLTSENQAHPDEKPIVGTKTGLNVGHEESDGRPVSTGSFPVPMSTKPPAGQCYPELDFLKRSRSNIQLSDQVRYTRRCFDPTFSETVDRDAIVNFDFPLFNAEMDVDIEHCSDLRLPPCHPIKVMVPTPYAKKTYSHLMFGISTAFGRLTDSLESFAHSLAGTEIKLIALVTDWSQQDRKSIEKLQKKYRDAGVMAELVAPLNDAFTVSQSHFTVIIHMMNSGNPDVQWYGLLDDDTFYPNLRPLSDALAKIDHTRESYVGTLSEDWEAVRNYGFMAFGGAGAYLSAPLAKVMADNAENCLREATSGEGDIIIRDCVYFHSRAKLTSVDRLYQQDFHGDPSGFFEAGLHPINLHHWKSWYTSPVVAMSEAATFCGDCFLQRFAFGGDTVLSNGYSIARYRNGLASIDLDLVEGTWDKGGQDFDFSIGPLRPRLSIEEKRQWKLEAAEISEKGDLSQLYVRRGNHTAGEVDEVVELWWHNPVL